MINAMKLPFPRKGTREYTLHDTMILGQWTVPKDTVVKLKESENFGWIILSKGQKDIHGNIIPKRIFRY